MEHFSKAFANSRAFFERAAEVIPGGIYGHMSPTVNIPGGSPYYAVRAKGCRYEDVDGNELIDFMCGYGPIILGYQHPEVEEAAERQRREGNCFNHPTVRMLELAERLVELVDFADWAVFGKNGSDMTTWAVRLAREHTGRKKILHVKGAYHGIDAWCSPGHGGLIDEDREHIHTFRWNDLEAVEHLFSLHRKQIAGVMVTPFHHPAFGDSVLPAEGFLPDLQKLCQQNGSLLIMDDIRAGFRLHVGGSHRVYGFEPDIACFCKALGNGYALSSAVGRKALRPAANRVFLTGSYWNSAVPMAAALKTLDIIERENVPALLEKQGQRFMSELAAQGERHGYPCRISGPPAVPYLRFEKEGNFIEFQRFCRYCMEEGVFLHPHHNWFICAAHDDGAINQALEKTERAFNRMKS